MGIMNELAEVIAVFIPDFLALGMSALAFFSLYCWAGTRELLETKGMNSGLLFSLLLGYAVTVVLNLIRSFVWPPAPRVSSLPRLTSGVRQAALKPSARPCSGSDPATRLEMQLFRARRPQESPAAPDAGPRYSG